MTKHTIIGAMLATTMLAGAAAAQDVTLTIESWRNDDLAIWQDKIIPAFEAANPGIKVKFTPSAPAEYNAVLNSKLDAGSAGDIITCRPFDASLALFEDGKTYLEAEVSFQKTRVAYVGDKARQGLVFGLGALAFLHLALIGLVIGLIFALAPYLTAFGSTAVVVGILLIGTVIFARRASRKFGDLGDAFSDPAERNEQD